MRIVIFAAFYLPYRGGYVESIRQLVERLVERGHKLLVITCNTHQQPDREVVGGVEIFRMNCWNPDWLGRSFTMPHPAGIISAWQFLKNRKFDIISTQTRFFPTTWLGFIFAKVKNIPVVHTERGSRHTASGSILIRSVSWVIDHTFGFIICRFSDVVVGVSRAACDFASHLGTNNPVKIYNGIDADFWERKSPIGGNGMFNVIFVGRLIEAKGVQNLLKAITLLKAKVLIVGDGPYRKNLEGLSKKLNIENKVIFLGEKNQEEIRELLHKSDVFVNPSYSEGLPRSVLEAGAAGIPIIATDAGGTREIIPDDNYGLLVEAGNAGQIRDKLKLLMADSSLCEQLGDKASERIAANFNWEKIVGEHEKVLLSAVQT